MDAQIYHGMTEAGYGYWGFSPANRPEGDYGAWGVDGAGMDPNGMPSNEDNTLVDHGFAGCPDRPAKPDPPPVRVHQRRRHAARRLPRRCATRRRATAANVARLARDFPGMYGQAGASATA